MIHVGPVATDDERLASLLGDVPDGTRFLLATRSGVPVGCCGLAAAGHGVVRIDPLVAADGVTGVERALLAAAERLAARLGAHTVVLAEGRPGIEVAGYSPGPDGYAKGL
ncbi:MAG TPA: hypothetical protein VGN37_17450 [Actinocatenispora sp.]